MKTYLDNPADFTRFVTGLEPRGRQLEFYAQQGRWRVRRCGRRFGKSELTCAEVLWHLIRKPNSRALVVGPSLDQARIYFDSVERWASSGNLGLFVKEIRHSPFREVHLVNGSYITARSSREGGQAVRGRGYDFVAITEAAYVDEGAVVAGIIPTTLDAHGPVVWAEGTPWSTNSWFYRVAQEHGEVHASVWDAPHLPRENILALQAETDPYYWRVEYEAEWVDDQSSYFPYTILAPCLDDYSPVGQPADDRVYSMGVDLAKAQDYTAIMVVDITEKPYRVAAWEWFTGRPYIEVAERVNTLAGLFRCQPVVDASGVGDAVIEQIPACRPVKFTAQVKQDILSALRAAVERREIVIPTTRAVPLAEELKIFRQEVRPGGLRLAAPAGRHDDCVIALALAVWAARPRRENWGEINRWIDEAYGETS